MKKQLLILAIASLMIMGFSLCVHAGSQDFTLINKTGVDIYELYISPSNSEGWEEEMLGKNEILKDGESVDCTFDGSSAALWDIMIKDKDGNDVTWEKFNLKKINIITLYMKGDKVWAEYE